MSPRPDVAIAAHLEPRQARAVSGHEPHNALPADKRWLVSTGLRHQRAPRRVAQNAKPKDYVTLLVSQANERDVRAWVRNVIAARKRLRKGS